MSEPRKPSLILMTTALAMLLVAGYVGSYYVLVHAAWLESEIMAVYYWNEHDITWENYRRWQPFFTPIHWLDRRLRPYLWDPK